MRAKRKDTRVAYLRKSKTPAYKAIKPCMWIPKETFAKLNSRVLELETQLEEVTRKLKDEIVTNDQMFSSDDCL
ncbi:hypothetical protein CCP3SC1AL1_3500002 [Gammaproteobacteria bacterium]